MLQKLPEDDFEELEIPSEDCSNSVSNFAINDNKLLKDKGRVREADESLWKSQLPESPKKTAKAAYGKSMTIWNLAQTKFGNSHGTTMKKNEVEPKKRNTSIFVSDVMGLSRLDSPDILKCIRQFRANAELQEKSSRDKPVIGKKCSTVCLYSPLLPQD